MISLGMEAELADLLGRLRLRADHLIDRNDSFFILRCHDGAGTPLVLKCIRTESADAYRRLRNEALLTKHLPVQAPLRLLSYRDHGPRHLLTYYDPGMLLRPNALNDGALVEGIADALVRFQSITLDAAELGVVDREHVGTYYVKVMLKHLLHLLPFHITLPEALECLRILLRAMPAILRQRVICHGDFLPTNLLYHSEDGTITFTDLEGFMSRNHPLFDVLALFTIDEGDLLEWGWQPRFLRYYVSNARTCDLDARSAEFGRAYRGILVFFLAYRLSETRIALRSSTYFDGLGRLRYLGRKLFDLALSPRQAAAERSLAAALEVRRRNLRRVLSTREYLDHVGSMALQTPPL